MMSHTKLEAYKGMTREKNISIKRFNDLDISNEKANKMRGKKRKAVKRRIHMVEYNKPKRDGSGGGVQANRGRNPDCSKPKKTKTPLDYIR